MELHVAPNRRGWERFRLCGSGLLTLVRTARLGSLHLHCFVLLGVKEHGRSELYPLCRCQEEEQEQHCVCQLRVVVGERNVDHVSQECFKVL